VSSLTKLSALVPQCVASTEQFVGQGEMLPVCLRHLL